MSWSPDETGLADGYEAGAFCVECEGEGVCAECRGHGEIGPDGRECDVCDGTGHCPHCWACPRPGP